MTTSADLASITAADIMRTSVVTVDASAPIAEAERLLSEHRIGGAPVTDEAGHICGVVSIRDILERYADAPEARAGWRQGFYDVGDDGEIDERPGIDIPEDSGDTVRDVMTAQVHTVETTTLKEQ